MTLIHDEDHYTDFVSRLQSTMNYVAEKMGEYLAGKIAEKISRGDPDWAPNATATIAKKGSSKVYVDSGQLFDLITNIEKSVRVSGTFPPDNKVIRVGIFDHDKGLIAHWLEYGTDDGRIPERPLIRLVFDIEKDRLMELFNTWFWEEWDRG